MSQEGQSEANYTKWQALHVKVKTLQRVFWLSVVTLLWFTGGRSDTFCPDVMQWQRNIIQRRHLLWSKSKTQRPFIKDIIKKKFILLIWVNDTNMRSISKDKCAICLQHVWVCLLPPSTMSGEHSLFTRLLEWTGLNAFFFVKGALNLKVFKRNYNFKDTSVTLNIFISVGETTIYFVYFFLESQVNTVLWPMSGK